MKPLMLSSIKFDELVRAGGVAVVHFGAGWCGPCRTLAPVLEAAAGRHPDVAFGTVDTDHEVRLAERFQIAALPTIVFLRDGVVVKLHPGVMDARAIDQAIHEAKTRDVTEARPQADARRTTAP